MIKPSPPPPPTGLLDGGGPWKRRGRPGRFCPERERLARRSSRLQGKLRIPQAQKGSRWGEGGCTCGRAEQATRGPAVRGKRGRCGLRAGGARLDSWGEAQKTVLRSRWGEGEGAAGPIPDSLSKCPGLVGEGRGASQDGWWGCSRAAYSMQKPGAGAVRWVQRPRPFRVVSTQLDASKAGEGIFSGPGTTRIPWKMAHGLPAREEPAPDWQKVFLGHRGTHLC